nr:hypothetical protein BaRGS_024549 [Batillaria attramentaria]
MKEIQAGKTQAGEKKPPPKPPMVLGKMRQFRFLQYRDYAPETLSQSPLPHSTMTAQDFRNRLQQAMQVQTVFRYARNL